MRKEVNQWVRRYAIEQGGDFESAWNELYRLYNAVLGQNVKSRATNRKVRPIEAIEQDGNLAVLLNLAKCGCRVA